MTTAEPFCLCGHTRWIHDTTDPIDQPCGYPGCTCDNYDEDA